MTAPLDDREQPPNWSPDLFSDAAQAAAPDRGLIAHVPIIAVLQVVQGVLELLFCAVGVGFMGLVFFGPQKELGGMRGLGFLMLFISVPTAISGPLRIV